MITEWNILSAVKQKINCDERSEGEILSVCSNSLAQANCLLEVLTCGRSKNEALAEEFGTALHGVLLELGTLLACQTILHNNNSGDSKTLKSESVGGYSVSYETDSDKLLMSDEDIEKRELQIINKWLEPTDLMYRGVGTC